MVVIVCIGSYLRNFTFGNRLRSTRCSEFSDLKLCRPAYFVHTEQIIDTMVDCKIPHIFMLNIQSDTKSSYNYSYDY